MSDIPEEFTVVCQINILVAKMGGNPRKFMVRLTKEFLIREYWRKGKSVRQIAKEVGCSRGNIRYHMNKFGIPRRKRDEAIRLKSKKHIPKQVLYELYCKQKLGGPTIAKKLGCSYATVYKLLSEYNIPIRSLSEAYFCHAHPLKGKHRTETAKRKLREARKRQRIPTCLTRPELKMKEICERHNIPLKYVGDGSFWISGLNPDFVDEDKKIVVEVFGRFWHTPNGKVKVPYYRTYEGRQAIFRRKGWIPIFFWEDEISEGNVLNKLGGFYGRN